MAEAILDLRLDTVQPNRVRLVYGVQNDYNSRYICARFTVNGKPIDIEKTAAVRINAKRPDGNKDAFPGTVNTDGTAKVPVAQWMLDVPGEVSASITAVTTSGALTTQEFYIMAKASIWDSTGEPSAENPDKDVLQTIIAGENERVAAESTRVANENARKSAETARATAETKRIADEATRVVNEAGRVSAEEFRREEFATWQDEWGKISSFDKRLENLEAAVSPGLVTPTVDSTVAYSKTVPANVLPNAAVCEVGGMTYVKNGVLVDSKVTEVASVGTNLFDAEKRLAGVFNSAGDLQLINGVYEFYKYKFKEETQYTISGYFKNDSSRGNVRISVVYTDGTKDTEGLANNTTEYIYLSFTSVAKKTINYIGVYYGNAGNLYIKGGELMINEGTKTKPYTPYFRKTLPIPGDALDGWGQGVNAQCYNKLVIDPLEGVKKYRQICAKRGYLAGDETRADVLTDGKNETVYILENPVETNVSAYFTDDNLLPVEAGGTITAVNEFEQAVPFTIEYTVKGA